jgi:hypothetical protein
LRLPTEFVRLPFKFDVEQLSSEVQAFSESDWIPHPQGFAGNLSIPLISLRGEMNNSFNGPMKATQHLERSPYIRQVLATIGEVYGRSRLMGLAAGCAVPQHRDINYHWYNRVRIHIPVITNPDVLFFCGDTYVHMEAGDTWIFDSWKPHSVENRSSENRVHLVVDTAGSARFWQMVGESEWRCAKRTVRPAVAKDQVVAYDSDSSAQVQTEQFNAPIVMHPGEVDALLIDIAMDLRAHAKNDRQAAVAFEMMLQNFRKEWRRLWSLYGESSEGWPHFRSLIESVRLPSTPLLLASNNGSAIRTFSARVLNAALNESLAADYESA